MFVCGDWLIWEVEDWSGVEAVVLMTMIGLGVLNAPVEDCWSRSKISCSDLGRRGGVGPVEKGVVA